VVNFLLSPLVAGSCLVCGGCCVYGPLFTIR
jgi:hypothetical protein